MQLGIRIFLVVLVGSLLMVIVGASTNLPPLALGIVAGVAAFAYTLVVSSIERSRIRNDRANPSKAQALCTRSNEKGAPGPKK